MKKSNILKRVMVITLVAAITLAGCGGSSSSSSSANNSNSNAKNSSAASASSKKEEDTSNLVPIDGPDGIDVSGITTKAYDSTYVAGDAGYEYYYFNKDTANRYANIIKNANKVANGKATVYDIIIPTGMDTVLPDKLREAVSNTNDQKEAIQYMYDAIGSDAKCVSIIDTLRQHKKEYLYFRTDHHWTALGAYYAYRELCNAKGIDYASIESFDKVTFDGFIGSFYTHTEDVNLKSNPDVVEAYVPKSTNNMKFTDKNGTVTSWKIIKDVTSWNSGAKYNTFIGGDNPYSEINNPNLHDGSACIVVKESFGNAMIPFLVDHYENIYVVDYRYYTGSLSDLMSKNKVTDIIFMNAISAGMGSSNLTKLENFVK